MIEQSFIVVQRREGFEKVYQVGNDLMKAICYQKALIASDEVTDELLEIVRGMIKQEELDAVIKNLNALGRDRIANDEEEVYIIAFFARENLR